MRRLRETAFTLVELVVTIAIVAILASVATLYYFSLSNDATENALKRTLHVLRDAIELYAIQNRGNLPGEAGDLDADLLGYLRGDFPPSPTGVRNSLITYVSTPGIIRGSGNQDEGTGWKYNQTTGELICNHEDWDEY